MSFLPDCDLRPLSLTSGVRSYRLDSPWVRARTPLK